MIVFFCSEQNIIMAVQNINRTHSNVWGRKTQFKAVFYFKCFDAWHPFYIWPNYRMINIHSERIALMQNITDLFEIFYFFLSKFVTNHKNVNISDWNVVVFLLQSETWQSSADRSCVQWSCPPNPWRRWRSQWVWAHCRKTVVWPSVKKLATGSKRLRRYLQLQLTNYLYFSYVSYSLYRQHE